MTEQDTGPRPSALFQNRPGIPEPVRKTLEAAFESFARETGMRLSAYLRSTVAASFAGIDELSFSAFLEARSDHSCAATIDPGAGRPRLLLDIEPGLFFALLELMLGAKPASRPPVVRTPTAIEQQLIAVPIRALIAELDRAWSQISPAAAAPKPSFQFGGIEARSRVHALFPPSTSMLTARFEVAIGDKSRAFTLVIPAQFIATAATAAIVSPAETDRGAAPDVPESTRVQHLMLEATVRVDAWLEGVTMQFRDLVQLREGCVIKFDHATTRRLSCTLNGAAGLEGHIVSTGRKRAFLLESGPPEAKPEH